MKFYGLGYYSNSWNLDVQHKRAIIPIPDGKDYSGSSRHSLHFEGGGFVIPRHFSLGLGLGIEFNHKPNFWVLPFSMDARIFFNKVDNSLFLLGRMKMPIEIGDAFKKAVGFDVGTGYKFLLSDKRYFIAEFFWQWRDVSMTHQQLSFSDDRYRLEGVGFSIGYIIW